VVGAEELPHIRAGRREDHLGSAHAHAGDDAQSLDLLLMRVQAFRHMGIQRDDLLAQELHVLRLPAQQLPLLRRHPAMDG
jgi:hypothetical protein